MRASPGISSSAATAYLSSSGLLPNPNGGSLEVKPAETTDFVLIFEAPHQAPRILSQRIAVRGGKGESGVWPPDQFSPLAYENHYSFQGKSLAQLAQKTETVLRDTEKLQFHQFSSGDSELVFCTAFSEKSNLTTKEESPRKIRRIAYRLALSSLGAGSEIGCEYQRDH